MTSEAEGRALENYDSTRVGFSDGKTSAFKAHLNSFVYPSLSVDIMMSPKSQSLKMSSQRSRTKIPSPKAESVYPNLRSGRKRAANKEDSEEIASHIPVKKKKKTTTKERAAADPHNPVNNLVDSLRPDLMLVFIGLNPGLMTAATG